MRGYAHALIGAGLALTAAAHADLGVPADMLLVPAGAIAALAPDIDSPESVVGRWLRLPLPHRGPTHWLLTAAAVGVAVWWLLGHVAPALAPTLGLVVGACWASHTLADVTNAEPVELLPGVRLGLGAHEGSLMATLEELAAVAGVVALAVHTILAV